MNVDFTSNNCLFGSVKVTKNVDLDKYKYSSYINNLILGEGPTQGLDDTTLTAEAKYPINFTQSGKRFVVSLHYNVSNSFLFISATKTKYFQSSRL